MGHWNAYEVPGGTDSQRDALDALLRSAPHFSDFEASNGGMYHYREIPGPSPEMPALYATLTPQCVEVMAYASGWIVEEVCQHLETGLRRLFGNFRQLL